MIKYIPFHTPSVCFGRACLSFAVVRVCVQEQKVFGSPSLLFVPPQEIPAATPMVAMPKRA
ncbi:MAG: hypothetical protein DBX63_09925 [Clostridia bacterium]|nr:MAG: hypothetical protein DBX63_09925 [Clostridia bacterium]